MWLLFWLGCAAPPPPPPLVEVGELRVAEAPASVELPYPGLPGQKLATFTLRDAALALRERDGALVAVVHPDPQKASALAEAGAPDAEVLASGAWALVRSADGAVHERGQAGEHVSELHLTP